MAWVYILECSDSSYYVGSTTNIHVRLHEHQSGRGSA
ncbi:GIY-YIG nuclease family protein [Nocardioides marmoribigeumensis]|nr:GIY-YIG nuclease family protein [Nocardioides marmoribigeumensis]